MTNEINIPNQRLAPAVRRQQILNAAIAYFAEAGFAVHTRELTRRIKVSQPLLYRYFSSKAELIEAVLDSVFLTKWKDSWLDFLRDRNIPIRDRLISFYGSYVQATYQPEWLRIYFFAGLAGFDFNKQYVTLIVEQKIITTVCNELRHSLLTTEEIKKSPKSIQAREIELVWMLQSSLFYGMVRQSLLNSKPKISGSTRLNDAVDLFLAGAKEVYPRVCGFTS